MKSEYYYRKKEVNFGPPINKEIKNVILFNKTHPPNNFAWGSKKELKKFLIRYE
jgi:hypothetical protein